MNICIVSDSGAWGPIHTVYNSIKTNTKHKVSVVLRKHDPYGFSSLCDEFSLFYFKDKEYSIRALAEADCIFIFGINVLESFLDILFKSRFWRKYKVKNPRKHIKSKKIIYFAACSVLLEKNKKTNNIYKQWPIDVFFYALDLKDYVKVNARKVLPYVAPMSVKYFPNIKPKIKNESIVLCHSPGLKHNYIKDVKGTRFIIKCFDELSKKYSNVSYKIIHNITNDECMKIKSQCDIFVDQIIDSSLYNIDPPYLGGQGKSGKEAMLLGCLAMTSYRHLNSEPYFPTTPIIQVNKQNLIETIEKFIFDEKMRNEMAEKQKKWVENYMSEEFFAKYIFDQILN